MDFSARFLAGSHRIGRVIAGRARGRVGGVRGRTDPRLHHAHTPGATATASGPLEATARTATTPTSATKATGRKEKERTEKSTQTGKHPCRSSSWCKVIFLKL